MSIGKFFSVLMLFGMAGSAYADCWEEAGREFSIAPILLYAIAEQESGLNPRAIGHNRNGTRDIGLMQINSSHLPRLAKYRITEKTLLSDSCQAVKVGAGILAGFMQRYGYSWEAVGAYNAGSANSEGAQKRRMLYAKKIAVRYQRLIALPKSDAALKPHPRGTAIPVVKLPLPAAQLDKPGRL